MMFSALRHRKHLITGGNGFVGSALITALNNIGSHRIRVVERDHGGICNLQNLERTFQEFKPDVVFHLAAFTEVGRSFTEPYSAGQTNILGTMNVLEMCRVHGVKSVVVASSDKAYGHVPETTLPYKEWMPLASEGDYYSATKRMVDLMAHDYGRLFKLPIRVLRCANIYGPGQKNQTTLITNSIVKVLSGQKPVIHNSAKHVKREWLYIGDAVVAYLWAAQDALSKKIDYTGPGSYAFNVGSGQVATTDQVVHMLLDVMEDPGGIEYRDYAFPQIGHQYMDSTKFEKAFPSGYSWNPTTLRRGLEQTVEWYEHNLSGVVHA